MNNGFTYEEKRKFMLKKHIREHLFEYILDIIGPMVLTVVLLRLCHAENYLYGIILSAAYSVGRIAYSLRYYKKHLDDEVK